MKGAEWSLRRNLRTQEVLEAGPQNGTTAGNSSWVKGKRPLFLHSFPLNVQWLCNHSTNWTKFMLKGVDLASLRTNHLLPKTPVVSPTFALVPAPVIYQQLDQEIGFATNDPTEGKRNVPVPVPAYQLSLSIPRSLVNDASTKEQKLEGLSGLSWQLSQDSAATEREKEWKGTGSRFWAWHKWTQDRQCSQKSYTALKT